MPTQPKINKKETSVSIPVPRHCNGLESTTNAKKQQCCSLQKTVLAVILSLMFGMLVFSLVKMKLYQEELKILNVFNTEIQQKLVDMKEAFDEQLLETDDKITANHKIVRKVRALNNCRLASPHCEVVEEIAFFYTSADMLQNFTEFQAVSRPYHTNLTHCTNQYVNSYGQTWCNNTGRPDTFYHSFEEFSDINKGHPDHWPWPYFKPSGIMMGEHSWLNDLTSHTYYEFTDNHEKIKIKKAGLYMIFASVTFNVYHGAQPNYAIRHGKKTPVEAKLKTCHLVPHVRKSPLPYEAQACLTFVIAYLEENDQISLTITANNQFVLGDSELYLGLYHLAHIKINP